MSGTIRLGQIAVCRSGDKGNHANIGVVARVESAYPYLAGQLTAERVRDFFRDTGVTRVERYELPNIAALNFVLYDALGGGASLALRTDTQGKLLGVALEELTLDAPERIDEIMSAVDLKREDN